MYQTPDQGFTVEGCIETIHALNRSKAEIEEAFSILSKTHQDDLALCRVWIRYNCINKKGEKHKRTVKMTGYHAAAPKDYYGVEKIREHKDEPTEVALNTLETYQPYLCSRYTIIDNPELQAFLPPAAAAAESICCLAICLRNIGTANLDYAFEFFFSFDDNNNPPSVLLKSLGSSLKTCLPSFKFASRELRRLDVDNLAARFNMLQVGQTSQQMPEALKEEDCKEDVN